MTSGRILPVGAIRRAGALGCVVASFGSGCFGGQGDTAPPTTPPAPDAGTVAETGAPATGPWFREVAVAAGVVFERTEKEYTGAHARFSGGVCLLDVNGDGLLDIFFPGSRDAGSTGAHLFVSRGPGLHYVDEAAKYGVADVGDGRGCVAADIDGDGAVDLVTTGLGGARMFQRVGGSFKDVTARLGTPFAADDVGTSAVAFDADGDGDLDLAIGVYGHFVPPPPGTVCSAPCAAEISRYEPGKTRLLLQQADHTFKDGSSRLVGPKAAELVLIATDLDDDGKIDLFVGNDKRESPDWYFKGDGAGGFREAAREVGVAFSASGSGICSMSATEGDVDGDGRLDLLESSWDDESSVAFTCAARPSGPICKDVSESLELFRGPRNIRWGEVLSDFDDDGIPELLEAVGHYFVPSDSDGFAKFAPQAPPILWHRASSTAPLALETAEKAGLTAKTGGRGVVAADLDGDGDLDVVVGTALGRPLLLENVRPRRGHHVEIRLAGGGLNTQGIGAHVIVRAGKRTWPAIVHAGAGFMSSDGARVHIGVGDLERVDAVDVVWPSGKRSHLTSVGTDTPITVREP